MVKLNLNNYTYKFLNVRYQKTNPPISIELIPKSCQGNSLYHKWPTKWWDKLRKLVYSRAGRVCEICGGGPEVQCHEVWEFDLEKKVQRLKYLMCLCKACHTAKHFGRSYLTGTGIESIKHLMKINNWTLEETLYYIDLCYKKHEKYSGIKFKKKLDLKILEDFIAKFQIKERKIKNVKPKRKKKKLFGAGKNLIKKARWR